MEEKTKKALIITLAVLAGIIAVTAAVTIFLRGRSGARFGSGNDVPYPYAWTERNDGAIALTLSVGDAKNGVWSTGSANGRVIEVSVGETKHGKTNVTLKPVTEGRETVVFTLLDEEDRLAEASFTVEAMHKSGSYTAAITDHRERAFQAVVHGGEETGHPFTVRGGENGLTIYVEDDVNYTDDGKTWNSRSTDSMVAAVSSVDISEEGIAIQIETRANGSAEVQVYNAARNISYVFTVEVKGGEMTLTDSRTEEYAADEDEEEDGTAETESEAQP